MNKFIMIEVGSTNTKAYLCEKDNVTQLISKTIEFKNHYKKENKIAEEDKKSLFDLIKSLKEEKIYIFGTSIFRNLTPEQQENWLTEFTNETGIPFHIVTSDLENEYTVYGVVSNISYKGKIAVMIGGGGSTELSIVENGKIIEKANSSFGAMDTTDMFPDLKTDFATSNYDKMIEETKKITNKPQNKADLLVLAGGDYLYFYDELKYPVEKNKFYQSNLQPYCLEVGIMDRLDRKFFYETSLEEICQRTNNDGWWRGARGMRLCVKAIVDVVEAKYIIPTRITMVYGIAEKIKEGKFE